MHNQPAALADVVFRVEIVISLEKQQPRSNGQHPDDGAAEFEAVLKAYLRRFVADLRLRTTIQLETKRLAANDTDPGRLRFQVFINEQRCRLPLHTNAPEVVNHRHLAFQVADVIRQNSALLMPESLSEALRKQWATGSAAFLPVLDSKSFNSLLVALIKRGHSVERARQVTSAFAADGTSPKGFNTIIEAAIESGSQQPLALFLPKKTNDATSATAAKESVLQKELQDSIFFRLGMQLPTIGLGFDATLNENEFYVQVNDLRHPPRDGLHAGEMFVHLPVDDLALFDINGRAALHPLTAAEGTIVAAGTEQVTKLVDNKIKSSDYWELLAKGVLAEAQKSAGSLLTIPILSQRIESLRRHAPNLVKLISSRFSTLRLASIMRELLDEAISIRDIGSLFEGLAALNGTISTDPKYITFQLNTSRFMPVENGAKLEELTPADYGNWLRVSLNRAISHQFAPRDNLLLVLLLAQELEARLRRVDDEPLTRDETEAFHQAILAELDSLRGRNDFVILTTIEVRKKLRQLIEIEFPGLAVLCYQELSQDLNIQPLARISPDRQITNFAERIDNA